jgi:hypothetical protein
MKQPQTQEVGNANAEAMNALAKERRLEDDRRANLERLADKCERLEAELAEAKKDAERYRWLRSEFYVEDGILWITADIYCHSAPNKADIDIAIDAAMSGDTK